MVTAALARAWLGNGCRSERGQSETAAGSLTGEEAVSREVPAWKDTQEQVGWVEGVGKRGGLW